MKKIVAPLWYVKRLLCWWHGHRDLIVGASYSMRSEGNVFDLKSCAACDSDVWVIREVDDLSTSSWQTANL